MSALFLCIAGFLVWSAFCFWLGWDERDLRFQEDDNIARLERIIQRLKS